MTLILDQNGEEKTGCSSSRNTED